MIASLPSVLARELSEAERALQEAGAESIEVRRTAPPRRRLHGPWRVVRQQTEGRRVQLVVAASAPLVAAGAPEETGND